MNTYVPPWARWWHRLTFRRCNRRDQTRRCLLRKGHRCDHRYRNGEST